MSSGVASLTVSQLLAETLSEEMARDPRVVVFGEDVGALGGVFGVSRKLQRTYGSDRVFDTPISETAFIGMAIGAAQAGMIPVVELMFVDFLGVCFDQIMNQMAKNTYMSGGHLAVPVTLRTAVGSIGSAAQHSQVLSATFAHIPGLKVVFPSSPGDACQMLRAAVRDPNPVVFLEHKWVLKSRVELFPWAEDAHERDSTAEFGKIRVLRPGADVAIVSAGWMVQQAWKAAEALALEEIEASVVDIRTLVPLDRDGLVEVARGVRHLLVVDEDYRDYGMCAEIMATIAERLGPEAPRMARLAPNVSLPASKPLEEAVLPDTRSIVQAVTGLLEAS
ncbi:MAG: transketolase C-terminal domain-containing protein [Actinomycetota bacterium]